MRIRRFALVLLSEALFAMRLYAATDAAAIIQQQTEELLRAIDSGSRAVWERYLHANAALTDENGAVYTKSQLVEQIKPFPPEISGKLQLLDFHARVTGDVAIATYVIDEHEVFHGHKLHSQYRNTDTWLKTGEGWRLLAYQALALRTDPPSIALPARQMAEYAGRYALGAKKIYEIRLKDGVLEGQETGRPPERLLAELPDLLFVPGKPRYRKVIQRGPDGRIAGFAERREAWDLVWTRLP